MKNFKARNVFGLDSSISKQHRQHILADAIACLINMSTRQSRVPFTWKFAKVKVEEKENKLSNGRKCFFIWQMSSLLHKVTIWWRPNDESVSYFGHSHNFLNTSFRINIPRIPPKWNVDSKEMISTDKLLQLNFFVSLIFYPIQMGFFKRADPYSTTMEKAQLRPQASSEA